jgi:uncharacterized HAD superfamily protein
MKVIKDIDSFITDMEIDKIFLDIDGVIFHSCQAMIDILNERYDGNFDGSDVTSWNFQCCYRGMTSEEIESMFNNGLFFKVVKPIDGALEFMDRYRDKIILVTKANIENYALKRKWFDDRGFKDIPMIALPLNVSKGFINMNNIYEYSLFIDDSTQNLIDCNADYKVQMREYCDDKEREWQKGWNGLVMYKW